MKAPLFINIHTRRSIERAAYGHLCPAQVTSVNMVLSDCRLIGLDDPCRPEKISKIDLSQRNFFPSGIK